MRQPVLATEGLSKAYGATRALSGLSIECAAGSVHAVVGENGAGKSTLMKLISGVIAPDRGTIAIGGNLVRLRNPQDAQACGVSTIFQEFVLLPNLSVAENLFLGQEHWDGRVLSPREQHRISGQLLEEHGYDLDPAMPVAKLTVGQQQTVEIAKGLLRDALLFIFDEPTAALAPNEVGLLFDRIAELRRNGKAVFYVSHRMQEIFRVADTITVLKDGELVRTVPASQIREDELIELMVGRPLAELFPMRSSEVGVPLLKVEDARSPDMAGPVSLHVREGEIVGLAGLEGHGQAGLMRLLMGYAACVQGTIALGNAQLDHLDAQSRIRAGCGFIPENRKDDGLFPSMSVAANLLTAQAVKAPIFSVARKRRSLVRQLLGQLDIKVVSAQQNIMALSGGNQQKVVLARWLAADVSMLFCEEPSRGVDVGAKREIYSLLAQFAAMGRGLLLCSRDLPELLGLCHRIYVISNGRIVADLPAAAATEAQVMRAAVGKRPQG